MATPSIQRVVGQLEGRLQGLETRLTSIEVENKSQSDKIDLLLDTMNKAKGSWRTLVAIGGLATAAIEAIHQTLEWLHR